MWRISSLLVYFYSQLRIIFNPKLKLKTHIKATKCLYSVFYFDTFDVQVSVICDKILFDVFVLISDHNHYLSFLFNVAIKLKHFSSSREKSQCSEVLVKNSQMCTWIWICTKKLNHPFCGPLSYFALNLYSADNKQTEGTDHHSCR